jgi:uncharacterized coiled-coil protein SlyX
MPKRAVWFKPKGRFSEKRDTGATTLWNGKLAAVVSVARQAERIAVFLHRNCGRRPLEHVSSFTMHETLERLEIKIAFLEAANGELSDVVYRQQKEIDALRERMVSLLGQFEEFQTKQRDWTPQEEKPPHY